jgi:uncharacterized protein (TIGR03437 family)
MAALGTAQTANPTLTLRVSAESTAAGGWAQIKVYADSLGLIAQGALALDLDPEVFGPIASVATFSASGDATGVAFVTGTHVEAFISSPSGGIGQLPGVPVFVVRAPVLPKAAGITAFISLSLPQFPAVSPLIGDPTKLYPQGAWADPAGNSYNVFMLSGRFFVQGTLSVENVTPGSGFHPAGTVLHIDGTGFDASTKVSAIGLVISSVQYVSSTRLDITTGSGMELTGLHFHIDSVDFFTALPSVLTVQGPLELFPAPGYVHAILPLTERQSMGTSSGSGMAAAIFLNPADAPVDVLVRETGPGGPISGRTVTVPAQTITVVPRAQSFSSMFVDAQAPLRMAVYYANIGGISIVSAGPLNFSPQPLQISLSPDSLVIDYQIGTPNPAPRTVRASYNPPVQNVTTQVDAGSWLKVATTNGPTFTELKLAFDAAGLAPGTYTGAITMTPVVPSSLLGFLAQASTLKITLRVSAQPAIVVQSKYTALQPGVTAFDPIAIDVSSNGAPAAFTVGATTDTGGNWLSVDVTSGVTPATVSFKVNTASLVGGIYRGHVLVQGPLNTVDTVTTLYVYPIPLPPLTASPPSLRFVREAGAYGQVGAATVSFQPAVGALDLQTETEDGGKWLQAMSIGPSSFVQVNVDAPSLPPGTYRGTITATSAARTAQCQVTLTVVPKPSGPLILDPPNLTITTPAGVRSAPQTLTVDSAGGPVMFQLQQVIPQLQIVSLDPLRPDSIAGYISPVKIGFSAFSAIPGIYRGTMTLTTSFGRVDVPVTINVTAAPASPPAIASVVNAASQIPGPLAPGEIVTIRGIGVGPAPVGLNLDAQGRVLTSAAPDAQVLINGIAAPIVYGSVDQWNVVVPYEVDGASSATIQVLSGGAASKQWMLPVSPSAPGIFTIGSTGLGRGAVLNQDNTVNSPSNPAPPGTVVQIFATGGGQLVPAGVTASITPLTGGGRIQLPVRVTIAGHDAAVVFAGPAPGAVSGLVQVNAVVPLLPFSFPTVPLTIEIGGVTTQSGVTIAAQ